jgi:hypothetical protein
MGECFIEGKEITIRSHLVIYGNEATTGLTHQIREEIEQMWNEPGALIKIDERELMVRFIISADCRPDISELEVLQNTDPIMNYFRIESFAHGNISFVDGLGCNTGYFLLENLYRGSTTAAHEYGHTLGLDHPANLDIRGQGVPGIMYPRGTLVDPSYQYDASKPAGQTGGTMHPMYRKVRVQDILDLKLNKLKFENDRSVIGAFSSVFHWSHRDIGTSDFQTPPVFG